jgi:DNA repair exonuclease SbcCD ATPase subunit
MKRTKQFELERNNSIGYGESIEELIKTLEQLNRKAKELGAISTSIEFFRGDYGYVEILGTRYMTPEESAQAEAKEAARDQKQLNYERKQYEALRAKFETTKNVDNQK